MTFSLGFSPCPNDTFIFDALVNHKIDTAGFDFEVHLEDVQTLNRWALQGKLDFSKISYGVLPLILNQYILLSSGGALGKGVGPLLISKSVGQRLTSNNFSVAIPGENTTAHMLFSLAYPQAKNKLFKVFNEIEDSVLRGDTECGVIIHENRFTYADKGLVKLVDLGEYWENKTGLPIPLGGIVANKKIDEETAIKINALIRKSVEYAFENNYKELTDYVKAHAQEMSEAVMRKHIDLYVNHYSVKLGNDGEKAVLKLIEIYQELHPENIVAKEKIFL
jgi:1,4-dihydroxy-6-naphthoate synthase